MNITFLLGNGFDINIGMQTRYNDFYKYYLQQTDNNEHILALKDCIATENWSDLEEEFGKYTSKLSDENMAIDLYNNLITNIKDFIIQEENKYEINSSDTSKMLNDLLNPESYLRPVETRALSKQKKHDDHYYIQIITFNYTISLERLINFSDKTLIIRATQKGYERAVNGIEHIHGRTNERMVLGVNDISQIGNESFRDSLKIARRFIKPVCNKTYGLEHDTKCTNWLNASNLICLYGLSFGETDKQ